MESQPPGEGLVLIPLTILSAQISFAGSNSEVGGHDL